MSKITDSTEEYNPFALMVELRIFKEFTVPIVVLSPIQRTFLDSLEKLDLTEEFKAFSESTAGPDSRDNLYTLSCIYQYLRYRIGIKVTDEYLQGKSVTPAQILEISRIMKYYFLMCDSKQEKVEYFMEYVNDAAQRVRLQLLFDDMRSQVLEILHNEYGNTGKKKLYHDWEESKLLDRK